MAASPSSYRSASGRLRHDSTIKAVLGPTNTGKTHLAIERLCAHSSGAIGFPLRLLAREVYDRVCAIKGESRVALITGEERIEPKDARWRLCTVEAMPDDADLAFIALDEAQLSADRERGHIYTDRLLHARGREETMLLGAASLAPLVRSLVPEAEITGRPRFSTLRHVGAQKLSRIPPRSAIVAFSAEQVYAVAEMLRRFRGGAAVVMGALSPQTRNAQVALYQSGQVDYLVATDAIGMGLNLDIDHVAFAGLSKFDGTRQRRLTTAEMAQIAGRAGRHQRDGTFGTVTGSGGGGDGDGGFTAEEVYAIEEHRFAPLTKLFWRNSAPRFASVATLIADLEQPPERDGLIPARQAIDLAVLKRLAEEPDMAATLTGSHAVRRFWDVCRLPDFRQQGAETHSRFVARLWQDLARGMLGADFVARAIADLDNPGGDIALLQGRIAAIRSWAYIAQRPDWVLAKEEMAARARAVEARLSDALHARLTERFVDRRTAVLMRKLGPDAALLPVALDAEDRLLVDGEAIGHVQGFRFRIDPAAKLADLRLLRAAAERHLPALLNLRAEALAREITESAGLIELTDGALRWNGEVLARLGPKASLRTIRLAPDPALNQIGGAARQALLAALDTWLGTALSALDPLCALEAASADPAGGPELRALLIRLVEAGGLLARTASGVERLSQDQRAQLRRLGIRVGALDLFLPAMLKPAALRAWRALGNAIGPPHPAMPPVLPITPASPNPPGYRALGKQAVRLDMAEKLLHAAHAARMQAGRGAFVIDPSLAISMGLTRVAFAQLLRLAGFQARMAHPLRQGAFGPPAPPRWRWLPPARPVPRSQPVATPAHAAFAGLAELVR